MPQIRFHSVFAGLVFAAIGALPDQHSARAEDAVTPARAEAAAQAVNRALKYLEGSQRADGGWEAFGESHMAITALVAKAFIQDENYGSGHPIVERALSFVLRFKQPDGGIYVPDEGHRNYHTSVALMALAVAGGDRYAEEIRGAQRYLKGTQWNESNGHPPSSSWHGGQGYGKHKRPDLSNTQLMLEALHESGVSSDDPVYRKAMVFVSRCQMLGETNDLDFARGTTEGGFIYTAANDGESKAGTVETVDGPRLRSYGSMTYAGFKSMLYANVSRDDPRVRHAWEWIRSHYTLSSNPNMPLAQSAEGLYYYYHVFARALDAWGQEEFEDARGATHRWRDELCAELLKRQRSDGSWINEEDRWFEGNPHLVTAYAVLTLQTALADR